MLTNQEMENMLRLVESPDVTEEQLQQALQKVSSAMTEVNVTSKIAKENLMKLLDNDENTKAKIESIDKLSVEESKVILNELITKADESIENNIKELKALTDKDGKLLLSPEDEAAINGILEKITVNTTPNQVEILLKQLNNLSSNAEANLNMQKKNLEQTVALAKDVVKIEIANFEDDEDPEQMIQKYLEAIRELEDSIVENIAAFREFKSGGAEGDNE